MHLKKRSFAKKAHKDESRVAFFFISQPSSFSPSFANPLCVASTFLIKYQPSINIKLFDKKVFSTVCPSPTHTDALLHVLLSNYLNELQSVLLEIKKVSI